MASGYKSVHPDTEARLRDLGVADWQIRQGVGDYHLSAGTHLRIGTCRGREFGSCVDLVFDQYARAMFDRLTAAGFAPFMRLDARWAGNRHCHAVDVTPLKDDTGAVPSPHDYVLVQIKDFVLGLNGLKGHAALAGEWAPDEAERKSIATIFHNHESVRPVDVQVRKAGGGASAIEVYAFQVEDTTRVELRTLVEKLGGSVDLEEGRPVISWGDKEIVPRDEWKVAAEGRFTRCNLRPLAEALGFRIEWAEGRLPVATLVPA